MFLRKLAEISNAVTKHETRGIITSAITVQGGTKKQRSEKIRELIDGSWELGATFIDDENERRVLVLADKHEDVENIKDIDEALSLAGTSELGADFRFDTFSFFKHETRRFGTITLPTMNTSSNEDTSSRIKIR